MIRLETVEDFKKVRKVLDNPKSKPHEFCIKTFGYCTACKTITIYEGSYSVEGSFETCLRCKRIFAVTHPASWLFCLRDGHRYYTYISIDNIPVYFRDELKRLHSREFQLRVFRSKLNDYKKTLKRKVRKLNSEIREVAKLGT